MFSDPYEFIWSPQRPTRSEEEIKTDIYRLKDAKLEDVFCFKERVVVRELIHIVIEDKNFRDIFDGLLLPPPYNLPDLSNKLWTAQDVATLVKLLDPSLDGIVVKLPFNLAIQLGNYSARLHAASQRLCWILNVPVTIVEEEEKMIQQFHEKYIKNSTSNSYLSKQDDIDARRAQYKLSFRRTATIVGFSTLGGAALLLTGGVAAPMVASAYAALSAGLVTTIAAIGSLGGAVLGTGVLASIFAAVLGVTTHTAALTSLLTPVLTASHITAIFGASGAALSAYKAYLRTNDSDIFVIRSIDEVEELSDLCTDLSLVNACGLPPESARGEEEGGGKDSNLNFEANLSQDSEKSTRAGIVVPVHTFFVAVSNIRKISFIRKRRRNIVFALICELPGTELRLRAMKLTTGVWGLLPTPTIAYGSTGIFACMNRRMYPTGVGFVVCYSFIPAARSSKSPTHRLWVRVHCDFFGSWEFCSFIEDVKVNFDPLRAELRLETAIENGDFCKVQEGVVMTMRHKPVMYLKLKPFSGIACEDKKTFPAKELVQHMTELNCDVERRRKIGVAVVNKSAHIVCVKEVSLVCGHRWRGSMLPQLVETHMALLEFFTNGNWDLRGAEGFYILEIRNTHENAHMDTYFVRLQFEIGALNNLGVAVALMSSPSALKAMTLKPQLPQSSKYDVISSEDLFFSLSMRIVDKFNTIQLHVLDFIERSVSTKPVRTQARLTVAVCGYTSTFDPRRPPQDQQVGVWKSTFKDLRLVEGSDLYVLQWEDEYLARFGEAIDIDFDITDRISRKAFKKAKAIIKKELMQGVLFSGFRAVKSLMGTLRMPMYVMRSSGIIDNSYGTLSNRAVFTGHDLAKSLLDSRIGHRPVTLLGFSFGTKVVSQCLLELHRVKAFDIVDNVFLIGSTVPADTNAWLRMREVTAGRLVNVYTRRDWILSIFYKVNDTELRPMSGVTSINLPGVENVDVSAIVGRHFDYGFKLREVLKMIPLQPTQDTWSKKVLRGSPGLIISPSERGNTMKAMYTSLASIFSSTSLCIFSLLNGLVVDKPKVELKLNLLSSYVFNGFFDFRPPQLVPPSSAGVFAAIGEPTMDRIGGVVSFLVHLDDISTQHIILIILFCVEKKSVVRVAVKSRLVTARISAQESKEEAKTRLSNIVLTAFASLESVEKICDSETAMRVGVDKAFETVKIPIECFFLDGHNQATMLVDLERSPNGVFISVRALLTTTSTQHEQENFTQEAFDLICDQDNAIEGWEIVDRTKVYPLETLQNELIAIAENLSSTCTKNVLRHTKDDKAMELSDTESHDWPPTLIAVVIINSSSEPLYFFETESSSEDKSKLSDKDTNDPYELTSSDLASTTFQYGPPPNLPSRSFCVIVLGSSATEPFFSARYATLDGTCTFEIYITTPAEVHKNMKDLHLVTCNSISGRNIREKVKILEKKIGGMLFQQVFLKVKSMEETTESANFNNLSGCEMLKSRGWFII